MAPGYGFNYEDTEAARLAGLLQDEEEPDFIVDPTSPSITAPGIGSSLVESQRSELLKNSYDNILGLQKDDDSEIGKYLSGLAEPIKLSREQQTAGILLGILPLLGGLIKGKKGLTKGAEIGAAASEGFFKDATEKAQKIGELKAKRASDLEKLALELKLKGLEKVNDRKFQEEMLDKKLGATSEAAKNRTTVIDSRIKSGQDFQIDKEDRAAAEKILSYGGRLGRLDVIPKRGITEESLKKASDFDVAYQRIDAALERIASAVKDGSLADQAVDIADAIMAIKELEGFGAAFSVMEGRLAEANLPKRVTELSREGITKWLQAEGWRGEDAYSRTLRSQDVFKERAQRTLASYGFYIPGQKYKESVIEQHKDIPLIQGRTPVDKRGFYELIANKFTSPTARDTFLERNELLEPYKRAQMAQDPRIQEYLALKKKASHG